MIDGVQHSEVNQSAFLGLIVSVIANNKDVFLNINFPKIIRNRPTECGGPFPLS